MSFDSESGHWYKTDGTPCYQVPAKSKGPGGMRGVDLRWDRHLKLVPSVTTVTTVIAKPQLTTWLCKQAILAALTLPRDPGEIEEVWLDRVLRDSKQQVIDAANEGTRIHNAIEDYYAGRQYPAQYEKHVGATIAELLRLFPNVNDWISEKSFAHPLGFGGKVDLHSPSTGIVCDFKGKDGDFSDGKKLAYDQNIQLAAYQVGLRLIRLPNVPDWPPSDKVVGVGFNQCANIFVSRTHSGKVASHVWSADEVAYGWEVFSKALELWKSLKRYDGSF